MPLFDVKYHRLISGPTKGTDHQTQAQACMGVGDALVAGFDAHRYVFDDRDGRRTTVIAIVSQQRVLFGAYEFTRMA